MRRGESGLSLLLAIDKPCGPTSHDVVGRVRRALGERRVGHAGTLDPGASGVMVVGVGPATRLLSLLSAARKTYLTRIAFGCETTTDDSYGERRVTMEVPARLRDQAVAADAVAALVGTHDQVPPAYSAAHVDGRRAYALARAGVDPDLPARRIEIHSASLVSVDAGEGGAVAWTCVLDVSKGTYVRAIVRDLGRALGTAAHTAGLRRTASGAVTLGQCLTPDEVEGLGPQGICTRALDPLAALGVGRRVLSDRELECVTHGRPIPGGVISCRDGAREPHEGERVGLEHGGRLHGVWVSRGDVLSCVCNLPGGVCGVRL